MLKWLWLSVVVIALDQLSKKWASAELLFNEITQTGLPVYVMPSINWIMAHNYGASFGFLSDAGGWQRWFFVVLALVVSVVIVFWLKGLTRNDKWLAVALTLILGGAIGNVIDRALYGYVIDFVQFYYESSDGSCLPGFYFTGTQCNWPVFNIADMAIVGGAVLLIIDGIFGSKDAEPKV